MPLYGQAPLQVTFTDTSTPTADITYWHWDFGDGDTSEEQNPVHMYNSVGEYTVTLNIASGKGIDTYSDTVYAVDLLSNMVAGYALGEAQGQTRVDRQGVYDMTESGAVALSASGIYGGAAQFAAATYLECATGPGLSSEMTVSLWMKPGVNVGSYNGIFGKDSAVAANREFLLYLTDTGALYAEAFGSDLASVGVYYGGNITDNEWHHIVFWVDSSDKVNVQVDNGTVYTSAGTLNGRNASASPTCIGWTGRGSKFGGLVDEVYVWDATLDATQRTALFYGGDSLYEALG